MKTVDLEIAVSLYFDNRKNIVVPNISWGMNLNHECDLFVVRPKTGFAVEVEIKVSLSDLRKDLQKRHGHNSNRIKELYFAIPEKLEKHIDLIPERAGVLVVSEHERLGGSGSIYHEVKKVRAAEINRDARALLHQEVQTLARLAAMRIWPLKAKVRGLANENKRLRDLIKDIELLNNKK